MASPEIQVLTIRDKRADPPGVLAFDLRDLLRVLEPYLDLWQWCISGLECTGAANNPIVRQSTAAIWLSSTELVQFASEIEQTIDGQFIAFPFTVHRETITESELDLAHFPTSRAELVICAVDSTQFEVYAKDAAPIDRLRHHFKEVRNEDPASYFAPVPQSG